MPITVTGPGGQTFYKGRTPPPNLEHLYLLSNHRKAKYALSPFLQFAAPASFDAVAQGWVPAVKNQGQCGSCWDFSGTGVCEIAFKKAGQSLTLSEEYTLSCGRNGGCNGDDNTTVLDWAKKTGLPLTADYGPYTGGPGRCAFGQGMKLYKIDDWGFVGNQDGVAPTDGIKAAIMQYGCVGCAIAADNAFSNVRAGDVFDRSTSRGIDHDIILVGWDDSKGSKGAWKLRNSWGSGWCDGGYCWIGYGVNLVGTEAVFAVVRGPVAPEVIDWAP